MLSLRYYGVMAIRKMTFSLDELTAARIAALARTHGKSKSAVVRDAVSIHARNSGRVSEEERVERVRLFREMTALIERLRDGGATPAAVPGRSRDRAARASDRPSGRRAYVRRLTMTLLDTSVLVAHLRQPDSSRRPLLALLESGEAVTVPTLVLYEWWRGPRREEELALQRLLFPRERALGFGAAEAVVAADLYRIVRRPRGREIDLAIAACALVADAQLWTLNESDFTDIPGLRLAHLSRSCLSAAGVSSRTRTNRTHSR